MERENRTEIWHIIKPLTNEQKVILLMTLCSQPTRDTLNISRNLFTANMTEEQAYFVAIDEIVSKLGIDTISKLCETLNSSVFFDDQKVRKTLAIEPYAYEEKAVALEPNML
jgi:hypothetical protein